MFAFRRGLSWLACAVVLTACQEDGPMPSAATAPMPDLLRSAAVACERDGGRWRIAPGKVTYVCYRDLGDAGQICRADSDCEGLCLARSRTCSPIEPFYGCHEVLSDGGFQQTLCIE